MENGDTEITAMDKTQLRGAENNGKIRSNGERYYRRIEMYGMLKEISDILATLVMIIIHMNMKEFLHRCIENDFDLFWDEEIKLIDI